MRNIELSDVDGDALTIITQDDSTWITCTSGADEVTVGPFPRHLVEKVLTQGFSMESGTVASLVKNTSTGSVSAPSA
jgi:hypothetical protein